MVACGSNGSRAAGPGVAGGAAGAGGNATAAGGYPIVTDDYFPVPLAAGLAPTPPMGWSSWNAFACNVTADRVKAVADAMVSTGMKDAGYQYVNIDDCWAQTNRAADGTIQVDATRFPDGIASVADYVHGLGLKLGIYSSRGALTCGSRAGSLGHEQQDAETYAAWGVDYLKYDNCPYTDGSTPDQVQAEYQTMRDALRSVSRPIVYSLCAWNFFEWGLTTGQLWRTGTDIKDRWEAPAGNPSSDQGSFTRSLAINQVLAAYGGPNGWNDPDMLEVGNGGMTEAEYRAHFSLWALMAAPLVAGNDLTKMSETTKQILTNQEVIAVDQDVLGLHGVPVRIYGDLEVWAKPLNESGARAVALFNRSGSPADITARFSDVGLGPGDPSVRDLWQHADLGIASETYTATVPSHGVVMLKFKGNEPPIPAGTVYLSDLIWTYAANYLGPVEKDMSNGASAAGDGKPISLGGTQFAKGLGMSAPSLVIYRLGKACTSFSATVGIDDVAQGRGSVVAQVWADGEKLFDSGPLTGSGTSTATVSVDVTGKQRLRLLVTNDGDGVAWDRTSWGDAKLVCAP
jgi:alpha-galactosidase